MLTFIAAAAVLLASQPITFAGIGPVQVGASVRQESAAAGETLVEAAEQPSGSDNCRYVRFKSVPTVLFMVEDGRIVRVETNDKRFRTVDGARVGDTEQRVRQIYGRRLEIKPHAYNDDGHYFIVRSRDRRQAVVMETDGRRVTSIRAGLTPAAEYIEGCL